jgi:hypothetical protein
MAVVLAVVSWGVLLLLVLPLVLIGAALAAASVSIARSSVRITAEGVTVRNYPQPPTTVPLDRVAGFEPQVATGTMTIVRPHTAVLVLTDGTRIPVRRLSEPEAGRGVDAFNARVRQLRRG